MVAENTPASKIGDIRTLKVSDLKPVFDGWSDKRLREEMVVVNHPEANMYVLVLGSEENAKDVAQRLGVPLAITRANNGGQAPVAFAITEYPEPRPRQLLPRQVMHAEYDRKKREGSSHSTTEPASTVQLSQYHIVIDGSQTALKADDFARELGVPVVQNTDRIYVNKVTADMVARSNRIRPAQSR